MAPARLRPVDPNLLRRLEWLRAWARGLDTAFEIPGTGIRFGWDPILGLFPWLGDLVTPLFNIAVVVTAMQVGVPRVVQARMLLNVVVDAVAGSVPLVGDAFDVAWKANAWNMDLLDRHAWTDAEPTRSDWLVVGGIAVLMLAAAAVPILVGLLVFFWAVRALS